MIVLVRHGTTLGNADKTSYIDLDDDEMTLTRNGRDEVAALAPAIAQLNVSAVLVAPERRCVQTADGLGLAIHAEIDPRLRGQDWGALDFEGAREQLRSTNRWPGGLDSRFPGGESARDVLARCLPLANELRANERREPHRSKVVVTHGVTIRLLSAIWHSWEEEQIERTVSIRPGTAIALTFDERTEQPLSTPLLASYA